MAMPEEFSIATRDHRTGASQEAHDRVTGGGRLPLIAVKIADLEDYLRNLLLGGAVARAVPGLQHPARSRPLLPSQPRLWGNDSPVQRCQKASDRFQPIKTTDAERNDGGERLGGYCAEAENLKLLRIGEIVESVNAIASGTHRIVQKEWMILIVCRQEDGCRREYDDTCIVLRKPKDRCDTRGLERVHGEIATSTAAESCRSTVRGRRRSASTPRNLRHRPHCDGATPKRGWMPSSHRHVRNLLKSAIGMGPASRYPPSL